MSIAGKEDLAALENEISPGRLLLKMTVSLVEYTEITSKKTFSIINKIQSFFSNFHHGKFQVHNTCGQHMSVIIKTKSYG